MLSCVWNCRQLAETLADALPDLLKRPRIINLVAAYAVDSAHTDQPVSVSVSVAASVSTSASDSASVLEERERKFDTQTMAELSHIRLQAGVAFESTEGHTFVSSAAQDGVWVLDRLGSLIRSINTRATTSTSTSTTEQKRTQKPSLFLPTSGSLRLGLAEHKGNIQQLFVCDVKQDHTQIEMQTRNSTFAYRSHIDPRISLAERTETFACALVHRDEVYVSSSFMAAVQVYSTGGQFSRRISAVALPPDSVAASAAIEGKEAKRGTSKEAKRSSLPVFRPAGLAISAAGDLLVCDLGSRCVHVFRIDGTLMWSFSAALSDVPLFRPLAISVDHIGRVYVCDDQGLVAVFIM